MTILALNVIQLLVSFVTFGNRMEWLKIKKPATSDQFLMSESTSPGVGGKEHQHSPFHSLTRKVNQIDST